MTHDNTTNGNETMNVTYRVFEKDLNRTFTNTKTVKTMEEFNLFVSSMYSGNVEIVSVN